MASEYLEMIRNMPGELSFIEINMQNNTITILDNQKTTTVDIDISSPTAAILYAFYCVLFDKELKSVRYDKKHQWLQYMNDPKGHISINNLMIYLTGTEPYDIEDFTKIDNIWRFKIKKVASLCSTFNNCQ